MTRYRHKKQRTVYICHEHQNVCVRSRTCVITVSLVYICLLCLLHLRVSASILYQFAQSTHTHNTTQHNTELNSVDRRLKSVISIILRPFKDVTYTVSSCVVCWAELQTLYVTVNENIQRCGKVSICLGKSIVSNVSTHKNYRSNQCSVFELGHACKQEASK